MIQSGHMSSALAAPSEHVCAGPGNCYHTIQDAIDHASGNTTIIIDPKTYPEHLSVPGAGSAATLTLWANPSATVDGGGSGTVLTVNSGETVILKNLNLTHGDVSQGSGIYNQGTLSLQNSSVHNNGDSSGTANEGGGIFNNAGSVTLQGSSSVHDNQTDSDSAGIGNFGGTVLLEDTSLVYNNFATECFGCCGFSSSAIKPASCASAIKPDGIGNTFAGGILNDDGTLTLEDLSSVHHNGASAGGGIVNGFNSPLTSFARLQDKSSVHDNSAANGGGVVNLGTLTMRGAATVHNNTGEDIGGGGIANAGSLTMRNTSSVYANTCDCDEAGGIWNSTDIIRDLPIGPMISTNASPVAPNTTLMDFSTVHDNQACNGGGIYNDAGTGTKLFTRSPQHPNQPFGGGGITVQDGASVYHNTASCGRGAGGGIENDGGVTVLAENGSVHDNSAGRDGGGVFDDNGGFLELFDRASIYHNSSYDGAGVYDETAVMGMFDQTSLTRNMASNDGGGVYVYNGGTLTMYNFSSISHNSAGVHGGGILDDESLTANTVPAPGPAVTANTPDNIYTFL
jgi:hypothetical protein